ncbi:hypothetical protein PGT21_014831 [Puccinia graminis f. sp. tritici]|uniref:Chitin-binding type-4 domain-containing protein n=1 Tax=Puccinia graminis f. sp. tritici TaxID=56615 RepID=A0A5B0QFG8_PUCGR|nr:hypothetical protein PGT21_014831 [Puccinia graminis f. sp. tritici]
MLLATSIRWFTLAVLAVVDLRSVQLAEPHPHNLLPKRDGGADPVTAPPQFSHANAVRCSQNFQIGGRDGIAQGKTRCENDQGWRYECPTGHCHGGGPNNHPNDHPLSGFLFRGCKLQSDYHKPGPGQITVNPDSFGIVPGMKQLMVWGYAVPAGSTTPSKKRVGYTCDWNLGTDNNARRPWCNFCIKIT